MFGAKPTKIKANKSSKIIICERTGIDRGTQLNIDKLETLFNVPQRKKGQNRKKVAMIK